MRALMADDVRAHITTREGGVDAITGAEDYLGRIKKMDPPSAQFQVDVTQSVTVRPDRAMIMVEALPAESDAFWAEP
jgi:hypothetical protein